MKLKGFIFDLDGVIVSTDEFHYLAWKHIAIQEQIPFDREINNRLRGVSRMASLDILLEKANKSYSNSEKEILAQKKNELYKQSLQSLKAEDMLPGAMDILTFLRSKNVKLAIGSSSKNTSRILHQIGLDTYFDAVADGTDISNSKPDPEVFLLAAKRLNLRPSECAVIEDATVGIEAAKAGGMVAIAIHDATNSTFADYQISDLSEIKTLFSWQ